MATHQWPRMERNSPGTDLCLYLSGRTSWDKTDGVVTLHVPEQPPIETRLTEGDNKRTLCAIARLVNENGSIRVERINQYFRGQDEMDRAFGWGFRWSRGSK